MTHKYISLTIVLLTACLMPAYGQTYNQIDENGRVSQRSEDRERNRNFNPNSDDSTKTKEIPIGIKVWTVDRKFGDITPAEIDTMPHMFMRTTFNEGLRGEYNTIGNNYSARQNRIFADRKLTSQFMFTQPYSYVNEEPDEFHFTNSLSPLTNMSYYSCGDKTNGEDRLDAKFAVNANKRLGGGFHVNYAYARGYFSSQNTSHFGATLFTSYLGDRYQMHFIGSLFNQKTSENGGIENDNYILHPESYSESYSENEIPTVLSENWNKNNNHHLFLTHRYNIGFYKPTTTDTIKVQVPSADGSNNTETKDSIVNRTEFVPVTSFIHTVEMNNYNRTYIAYKTPTYYYANQYLNNDSVYDKTHHLQLKNTLSVALLEGFNKYAKAGLKAFISHELRNYELPDTIGDGTEYRHKYNEHNVSIGGKLSKREGQTLHYDAVGELWLAGEDAGQLKLDFNTDLNFPLFGDTIQLAAKAFMYRLNSVFYQRRYHARNFWWDSSSLNKETRTRIEGMFTYKKTNTRLRVAIEEIQDYTYLGMSYNKYEDKIQDLTVSVHQHGGNINVMTAQLIQDLKLGPLHWDNVITYQNSSDETVLPLPALNIYTNLYLNFKIAGVLTVDLGADATYFTKYYAHQFCPQLNQFTTQDNPDNRMKIGGYPFVNLYANMHLKRARFFVMMSNFMDGSGNKMAFLTPHYPVNGSILRTGISWNFFN